MEKPRSRLGNILLGERFTEKKFDPTQQTAANASSLARLAQIKAAQRAREVRGTTTPEARKAALAQADKARQMARQTARDAELAKDRRRVHEIRRNGEVELAAQRRADARRPDPHHNPHQRVPGTKELAT